MVADAQVHVFHGVSPGTPADITNTTIRFKRADNDTIDAIYAGTPEGSVIVTNWRATGKFIDIVYGDRFPLRREGLNARHTAALAREQGEFFVVLLDRSDSEFWRRNARDNASFIRRLRPRPSLELDLEVTSTDRLRIWRVTEIFPEG